MVVSVFGFIFGCFISLGNIFCDVVEWEILLDLMRLISVVSWVVGSGKFFILKLCWFSYDFMLFII